MEERGRLATHDGDSMETMLPLPDSMEREELETVYLFVQPIVDRGTD